MASTESDTRTSREDSLRSPKGFDDDDSAEHSERKRPLDGDSDLSDRKKSHFTGGPSPFSLSLTPSFVSHDVPSVYKFCSVLVLASHF